jgi:hypothetical protein
VAAVEQVLNYLLLNTMPTNLNIIFTYTVGFYNF